MTGSMLLSPPRILAKVQLHHEEAALSSHSSSLY